MIRRSYQPSDAQLVKRLGQLLFKDKWHNNLGHELGLDHAAMMDIADAAAEGRTINISLGILEDIEVLIVERIAQMRRRSVKSDRS